MENNIRILMNTHEDAMIYRHWTWKETFTQMAPLDVLAAALEEKGLPFKKNENCLSVCLGGAEAAVSFGCVLSGDWYEALAALLFTAAEISAKQDVVPNVCFVFACSSDVLPEDTYRLSLDLSPLGTLKAGGKLAACWQACYGKAAASGDETEAVFGILRQTEYKTEYDLPAHEYCADGALSWAMGLILTCIL